VQHHIGTASTVGEILAMLPAAEVAMLLRRIADGAREVALATLAGDTDVEVLLIDRAGLLLARSPEMGFPPAS